MRIEKKGNKTQFNKQNHEAVEQEENWNELPEEPYTTPTKAHINKIEDAQKRNRTIAKLEIESVNS